MLTFKDLEVGDIFEVLGENIAYAKTPLESKDAESGFYNAVTSEGFQCFFFENDNVQKVVFGSEASKQVAYEKIYNDFKGLSNPPPIPNQDPTHPEHYKTGGIETWDYLKAKLTPTELAGFVKGNVIKYVSRADKKGKIEDLKKAAWYLNNLIAEIEK